MAAGPNTVQIARSSVPGNRPSGYPPGQPYVNWPDAQFGVMNASGTAQDLLTVRFFSALANYNLGDFVVYSTQMYRANQAVTAGTFNPAQWTLVGGSVAVGDTPPAVPQVGGLWWDSVGGNLYVYYNDGTSNQWVIASNPGIISPGSGIVYVGDTSPAPAIVGGLWWDSVGGQLYVYFNDGTSEQWVQANNFNGGAYLPTNGGTLTGPLILNADPTAALGAATKEYVDTPVASLWQNIRYRNRIINGDMSVDQRNAFNAVSVTSATLFVIDRWKCITNVAAAKGASGATNGTAPGTSGFTNYLFWNTNAAAYAVAAGDYFMLRQTIEGCNFNDAGWGTGSGILALPVVLEFWAMSSLTGTFGGSLRNSAAARCYPFAYTITTANTWTKFRINIPGDTAGTWAVASNAAALDLTFSIGAGANLAGTPNTWQASGLITVPGAVSVVGTLNATLYITGVALMVGAAASNAEPAFKSYADNLIDCCRYFFRGSFTFYGYAGQVNNYIGGNAYFPAIQRPASSPVYTMISNTNNAVGVPTFSAIGGNNGVFIVAQSTAVGGCDLNLAYTADVDF